MNTPQPFDDSVLRDFGDLATHVNACRASRGRRHWFLSQLELAHALVAPRVVTSFAVVLVCAGSFLLV